MVTSHIPVVDAPNIVVDGEVIGAIGTSTP
jgi:hypothetical protein